MKKTLLLLLFLCGAANAQTVYVPDPGFKYNLIQNGVDTDGDGTLATTNLSPGVMLDVSPNLFDYNTISNKTEKIIKQ